MGQGRRRGRIAAIMLGVGLGAIADGIVLHQILQWHNMLSARIPPDTMSTMRANMVADGWFHAAAWLVTVAGVGRLYAAGRAGLVLPTPRAFIGLLLLGWGGFNLAEGIVDHHLLELHHVRDLPVLVTEWDLLFLAVGGVALVVLGWMLARER